MWVRMIAMLLAVGVLLGGLFGFQAYKAQAIAEFMANRVPPPVAVAAAEVERRSWQRLIQSIGILEANQGVDVSPSVAGLVTDILFESGQQVDAGTVLVRLDADVEKAELQAAQVQVPALEAEYDRVLRLAAQGNAPQARLDQSKSELDQLRANIERLRAIISRRSITAPFEGVLGIRQVDPGQYLQPGTAIVNLQDLSTMKVRFIVSQRDLARIAVGQPVRVNVDAYPDRVFEGEITAIEPAVEWRSGVVQVQAAIPNTHGLLRPGMFATLDVLLPDVDQVLAVPQSAVTFSLYGTFVYRLAPAPEDAPQKAQDKILYEANRVAIDTGDRRNNLVVVTGGLDAGDLVVTAGQIKLQNGTIVVVDNAQALAAPAEPPRL